MSEEVAVSVCVSFVTEAAGVIAVKSCNFLFGTSPLLGKSEEAGVETVVVVDGEGVESASTDGFAILA